jgi:pimeloyl-ACP methyl ester carboxylesterase
MPSTVLHLGGNGHALVRLDRAKAALERRCGLALVDVPYPGFEGRPGSPSFGAFLDDLAGFLRRLPEPPIAGYASGIGGLIALALRARGELAGVPLIFQGAVLWGLEARQFPQVMRAFPPARRLLRMAFGMGVFQRRFARKQFLQAHDPAFLERFFDGYRRCASFGDFFDWLDPGLLRGLERELAARSGSTGAITAWVGGLDHVVGPEEVRATEAALGVSWPVVTFPTWGHYPMIDVPEEWADALAASLAGA